MSIQSLLHEYLTIAERELIVWESREGDESDYMMRRWANKIAQIKREIQKLTSPPPPYDY